MRVFLDANVLFSASNAGSPLHDLVTSLIRRSSCVTNSHAIAEATRNLDVKRPGWLIEFRSLVSRIEKIDSLADVSDAGIKDKDKPILGGAVAAQCSHLVTGDRRDFGHLMGKTHHGVRIVTPKMLADELVQLNLASVR